MVIHDYDATATPIIISFFCFRVVQQSPHRLDKQAVVAKLGVGVGLFEVGGGVDLDPMHDSFSRTKWIISFSLPRRKYYKYNDDDGDGEKQEEEEEEEQSPFFQYHDHDVE